MVGNTTLLTLGKYVWHSCIFFWLYICVECFVDLTVKEIGFAYMRRVFATEFDCLQVTLCGWQDIKHQRPTLPVHCTRVTMCDVKHQWLYQCIVHVWQYATLNTSDYTSALYMCDSSASKHQWLYQCTVYVWQCATLNTSDYTNALYMCDIVRR